MPDFLGSQILTASLAWLEVLAWLPVALLGLLRLRAAPTPSILLLTAGCLGFVGTMGGPYVSGMLAGATGPKDFAATVQAFAIHRIVVAVCAGVPWTLLLVAIWRSVAAIPPADP